MIFVQALGFPESDDRIIVELALHGCIATRVDSIATLRPDLPVFVCGDAAGWITRVIEIRDIRPRVFVLVVTTIPDTSKWLDALEAGADDYCAFPLDGGQMRLLFRCSSGVCA